MAIYSGQYSIAKVNEGQNGVSCTGTTQTYQVGSSGITKPTGTWQTTIPQANPGQYLWIKTTFSYSDNSTSDIYSVSYMGTNGTDGLPGKNGTSTYVHVRYSSVSNPTAANQISTTPNTYIGICVNTSSTAPTTPADYTWSKFKGDDGQDGQDGVPGKNGIDGTTYYVHFAYADSSDGETGFSTTVSANKKYIGQCVDTTQADPTDYSKYKWTLIKGDDGAAGVGISKVEEKYAVSTSSSTAPASWQTTVPTMTATNKYLWNYEIITFTNNSTKETGKRVIGVYGDKGQDGGAGKDGKGIESIANYYLATASNSGVTASTSGWTTTVQTIDSTKKYLWNYEKITYTDNSTTSTTPCIIGTFGKDGSKGSDGQGIDSITPEYYVSTSNTAQTGGSWTTTMPAWQANKYCWTRNKIVWKNPTATTYTTAQLDTNWNKLNDLDKKTTVLETTVTEEQGKLSALIKQTDTDRKNTSDKFTDIEATVKGINTTIGDVQTKYNSLNTEITSVKSNITTIQAAADGLATRVTKTEKDVTDAASKANAAETLATQNANKFNWLVKSGTSQTDFQLTDRTADLVAQYINLNGKVTFNGLASDAKNTINNNINTAVNNISIGGRNLILNSNRGIQRKASDASSLGATFETTLTNDDVGKTFILSCDVDLIGSYTDDTGSLAGRCGLYSREHWTDSTGEEVKSFYNSTLLVNKGKKGRLHCTYTLKPKENHTLKKIVIIAQLYTRPATGNNNTFIVKNPKLERGNKPTDWSPAPEDKANQALIDAWTSEAVINGTTEINGGYIQTNTISSKHLVVEDIFATGSAAMNIISARQLNADLITAGTIKADRLSLYGLKVLNKTTNLETLNITENGEITLRGSVESYNYNDGKTGWAIHQNGDAEFNDVTVRGSVITNDGGIVSGGGSGINLALTSHVLNKGCQNFSYDSSTNTWSGVSPSSDDSYWGTGFYFSVASAKRVVVPAGKKLWITIEVFTDKDVSYAVDLNNQFLTGTASSKNDNDQKSLRTGERGMVTAGRWTKLTCSYTAPADRDLYDAGSYLGFKANTTIGDVTWKARNLKMEVGDIPTAFSFSPDETLKQVRFWAGSSYDERESAPWIVYNDGSMVATKGTFSGVFSGDIKIGNISIVDPSSVSGNDALLTIKNGATGQNRVLLRDTSSSDFCQNIAIKTDDGSSTRISLNNNGAATFSDSVAVGSGTSIASGSLTLSNHRLTTYSEGLLSVDNLRIGQAQSHANLKVFGNAGVSGIVRIGDSLVFGSDTSTSSEEKFTDKVIFESVTGGLNINVL